MHLTTEEICKGAARLEGTGVLQRFQLERETARINSHISAVDLYDRRAPQVRPNEPLTLADLVSPHGDGSVRHGQYSRFAQ